MTAVAEIYGRGGHFVLCAGKAPIWRAWNIRRPPVELVDSHRRRGNIGLIPASIGTSALDIDRGDPGELFAHHPARVVVPSRRSTGRHGYYDDEAARGNAKWDAYGCHGEIRSAKGFLVLYGDAPERLAAALHQAGRFPFPDDLFAAVGEILPVQYAPIEQGPAVQAARPRVLPMLETVTEGARNNSLFDVVRFHFYAQNRGQNLQAWLRRVAEYAHHHNQRFPDPLEAPEVDRLAYNVGSWIWSGGGPVDHSPEAQRRRGIKSGTVRKAKKARRSAAIVADRAAGMSYRKLAAKHSVTPEGARYIVRRDAPLLAGGCVK